MFQLFFLKYISAIELTSYLVELHMFIWFIWNLDIEKTDKAKQMLTYFQSVLFLEITNTINRLLVHTRIMSSRLSCNVLECIEKHQIFKRCKSKGRKDWTNNHNVFYLECLIKSVVSYCSELLFYIFHFG